jgi:hypothetical protein
MRMILCPSMLIVTNPLKMQCDRFIQGHIAFKLLPFPIERLPVASRAAPKSTKFAEDFGERYCCREEAIAGG